MSTPELRWSEPEEIQTKFGPRLLRRAAPTLEFIRYFESNREQMRLLGYTLNPDRHTGHLIAQHWAIIPQTELDARRSAIELSRATEAPIEIPCPEGRQFRGYQKAGVSYILNCFERGTGCLLGDEMGVGKTPQAIGVINAEPRICRALIICPAKLIGNWMAELRRWLARKMSVGAVSTGCFPSSDIVLCSFEMIHKFPNQTSYFWDLIVIDEAHRCANKKTIRSSFIFGCRAKKKGEQNIAPIPTRRKLALTGTPIPNMVMEFWPILNWLDPNRWNNEFKYGLRYAAGAQVPIGRGRKAWSFKGASNLSELREVLRGTILCRRLKRDVLTELPPKTRQLIELEAGESDANQEWRTMLARLARKQRNIPENLSADQFSAMAEWLEDDLRIAFDQMSDFRHKAALAKVQPFVDEIHERMAELDKVVIFGHHTDCICRLAYEFARYNPVLIIGETKNPQANVNRFQTDPACRMIIGSDSMMEGHTLTASSTVIFFEADWVPGKLAQKEDRLHRLGQKDNVLCLYYVLKDSLDARMIRRAIMKQEKIEQALDQ